MQAAVLTLYSASCPNCGKPLVQYLYVDADGFTVVCMFCHARFRCELEPDGFQEPEEPASA